MLNLRSCPKEQDPTWDTSLGFRTNLPGLIRSFAEAGKDPHLNFDSAKRVAEAAVESAIARFQRTGSARRWDGTFFTTWPPPLIGHLAKVDRKKAERINQELQKKQCQTFQTEATIDLACDQDRVLREHFPQVARSHRKRCCQLNWKNFTRRDIWNKRKTRTTKPRQHGICQSGISGSSSDNHPQPTELARALRHGGARREATRFVLKELRCRSTTSTVATPSRNATTLLTF